MAAVIGHAGVFTAALVFLPGMLAVSDLDSLHDQTPGLPGRGGAFGGFLNHLLSPALQYGRVNLVAQAKAGHTKEHMKHHMKETTNASISEVLSEDPTPVRHRLVVCNAYRGALHLAAIHKRPGRAAIPARWGSEYIANKTLISGIPFKTCSVSQMEFKEGDYIAFNVGGKDVGSFNTSGALGLSAGQEVSLVLVPYHTLGSSYSTHGAQFISHVLRTPKQRGGSQVILVDTLKSLGESTLKMEDRSGRFWAVHDDQEVTLQAGTYHFTALDRGGANVSSTALQVVDGSKNSTSAKYLVLRIEADPFSTAPGAQEFLTFSLPVPSKIDSVSTAQTRVLSTITMHSENVPAGATRTNGLMPMLRGLR